MSPTKPSAAVSPDAIKGSVKEAIGKLIGDRQVEAEGRSQQEAPASGEHPETESESHPDSDKADAKADARADAK